VLALSTAGALAVGTGIAAAPPVAADYSNTAVYQIEISGNFTSPTGGFGVWLWIELNSDGTGDYAGSDCGHSPDGFSGAAPARGDVRWTSDGTTLTISGVMLFGGTVPFTIQVPAAFGHYSYDSISAVFSSPFLPPFIPGSTIVQVAP